MKKRKKVRINLELEIGEYQVLKKAQRALGAVTLTEGIRRSAKLSLKISEFQKGTREVILRDTNGKEYRLVIV